jgi:hypothetical protein
VFYFQLGYIQEIYVVGFFDTSGLWGTLTASVGMDFIDFDSFQDDSLPKPPQPAMSLPIAANIENLGKRFSSLNTLTRSLLRGGEHAEAPDDATRDDSRMRELKLAKKFAAASLEALGHTSAPQPGEADGEGLGDSGASADAGLSARLLRVLGNYMSDATTREVFEALEQRSLRMSELVEPGANGLMARRELRSQVEADIIRAQGVVLREYAPVRRSVAALAAQLDRLNQVLADMTKQLARGDEITAPFVNQVDTLTARRREVVLKKQLLTLFRRRFTLTEYEEHLLASGDISGDFFGALARAEQIHADCLVLLALDNPKLGLAIMAKMNLYTSRLVQRIVEYCNKAFSNLHLLNTKLSLATIQQCLQYLQNQPEQLDDVISGFNSARSKALVDEFLQQINGDLDRSESVKGGRRRRSLASRHIVLLAHDPVRFIGDVLAYVHAVVVNERETINSIFAPSVLSPQLGLQLIRHTLSALLRPIESRITQIINTESKISTIHAIHNLLDLYVMMFSKQLEDGAVETEASDSEPVDLLTTVRALAAAATDKVFSLIRNKLLTVRHSNQAQLEMASLQPPEWILEFYANVLPVLDTATTATIMNMPKEQYRELAHLIVDEPIAIFTLHNALAVPIKLERLMLRANFLDLVLSKIMPITVLGDKVMDIHSQLQATTDELIDLQTHSLFVRCGLIDYVNVVNMICPFDDDFDVAIYAPIVENKLFTVARLEETYATMKEFLPVVLMEVQQQLIKLNSPVVVNDVVTGSTLALVKFYHRFGIVVEEYLHQRVFVWSDVEVATLLGVDTVYKGEANHESTPS